ncbi:hypothetical protein MKW94_026036 [Papaver nudicaule]|uniref:Uncharacterized protein n=1 Tax=Papaver nudicaule TaxID=74823 RepID=A0AA41SAW8_PAPNU|nr:hypothetical protein [Papaver nudicaule]
MGNLVHPKGPQQVEAEVAMESLRNRILDELRDPANISRAQYLVNCCRLILGTWEMESKGVFTPKLLKLGKDRVIKDVEYCALGNYEEHAEKVLREGYHENMSIKDGKDLLVRAIKAACFKDFRRILGGSIEVCVLMPRDYTVLPLSRRQQALDRAITFIHAGIIPEEEREQRQAI